MLFQLQCDMCNVDLCEIGKSLIRTILQIADSLLYNVFILVS